MAPPKELPQTLFVHASVLNLRERPSPRGPVLGELSLNSAVATLDRKHGFVLVRTRRGQRGWLAERFLGEHPLTFDMAMYQLRKTTDPFEALGWLERLFALKGPNARLAQAVERATALASKIEDEARAVAWHQRFELIQTSSSTLESVLERPLFLGGHAQRLLNDPGERRIFPIVAFHEEGTWIVWRELEQDERIYSGSLPKHRWPQAFKQKTFWILKPEGRAIVAKPEQVRLRVMECSGQGLLLIKLRDPSKGSIAAAMGSPPASWTARPQQIDREVLKRAAQRFAQKRSAKPSRVQVDLSAATVTFEMNAKDLAHEKRWMIYRVRVKPSGDLRVLSSRIFVGRAAPTLIGYRDIDGDGSPDWIERAPCRSMIELQSVILEASPGCCC